jgi:signal transduction histidine kinase
VYLCCLESIQNAAKHAGSRASVTVVLRREGDELAFSVHDTGRGFDPTVTAPGAGHTGVRDRIETIGGRVEITAAPGPRHERGRRRPMAAARRVAQRERFARPVGRPSLRRSVPAARRSESRGSSR